MGHVYLSEGSGVTLTSFYLQGGPKK